VGHSSQVEEVGDGVIDEVAYHPCQVEEVNEGFPDEVAGHSCQIEEVETGTSQEEEWGFSEVGLEEEGLHSSHEELKLGVFHADGELGGLLHWEDKEELGVSHTDEAPEGETHSVDVALGVDGETEALGHSPHCEEVDLGVDPKLGGIEDHELVAVANEEDQVSVCVLGSLFTTPPNARLARAR
jgi:hypothetical protein